MVGGRGGSREQQKAEVSRVLLSVAALSPPRSPNPSSPEEHSTQDKCAGFSERVFKVQGVEVTCFPLNEKLLK